MKNVFTILGLLLVTLSFSQSKNLKGIIKNDEVQINNLSISVTVDSAEEVESIFNMNDVREILETLVDNQEVSFEIICNGNLMTNGEKSTLSCKVNWKSDNIDLFLKSVKKMRQAAINYYEKQ
ncbi:MAG: hypothetical protein NWQ07_01420 [Flaviramulus sp.]|nr:hypothetical protein [Flaviramulus sp.]